MLRRVSIAVSFAVLLFASHAHAQTAQRWSIQLSALGVELTSVTNDELRFGGGVEIQGRYNPSALSIGFGFQTTRHTLENQLLARNVTVTYTGGFVEPRLILGSRPRWRIHHGCGRLHPLHRRRRQLRARPTEGVYCRSRLRSRARCAAMRWRSSGSAGRRGATSSPLRWRWQDRDCRSIGG